MAKTGLVTIVGRMNVGKSTLFNRLSENERSITLNYEGVTRDFIKDTVSWNGHSFELADSGGINFRKTQDELFEKVREKVLSIVSKSDVIVFIVDGTVGILPEDREISQYLHKLKKPVILAINKLDNSKFIEHEYEFKNLGFNNIVNISAQHGTSMNTLLDLIITNLSEKSNESAKPEPKYKVVLLGKPNVGKSSLMNLLVKEDRSIVSDIAGTTREAISESVMFYKEAIEITDTAGIRRKKSVSGELEPLMVKSSFFALKESNVVVLLIDGNESTIVDQELKLAFYAFTEHYKALLILINKSDLFTDETKHGLENVFEEYAHLIKKIPVLQISCKTEKNIGKILPTINEIWQRCNQQFAASELKTLFMTKLIKSPMFCQRQPLQVFDAKQINTAPITILLEVNNPIFFGSSQIAFFENVMRKEFKLTGVPIKFIIKKEKL